MTIKPKEIKIIKEKPKAIDKLIRSTGYFKNEKSFCVIATGGYGRQEMAPFSDVDILLLTKTNLPTSSQKKKIEQLVQTLWDQKYKASPVNFSLNTCLERAEHDQSFFTSLMDARFVCGDKKFFTRFQSDFEKLRHDMPADRYVREKLAERDRRHKKMGDSRYVLEPNIKEGKGGLRDLQTLVWLSRFLYNASTPEEMVAKKVLSAREARLLENAHHFLWTVRYHLHDLTGRAEERLTFDVQPEMARRLGYRDRRGGQKGVERFMKHYFLVAKDIGNLTRTLCALLESESRAAAATTGSKRPALKDELEGFPLKSNRLSVANAGYFKKHPVEMLHIFRVAQKTGYDIHPEALRWITANLKAITPTIRKDNLANMMFLNVLTDKKDSENTLRRMNEAGLLGAFVPDFARIVAHMQYDMYHVYTADEHIIRAIGMLHKIENGKLDTMAPLATALFPKIKSGRALYVAMLLHDIAKGRGGDHSEKGGKIAKSLCPRFGLSVEETETVIWLVENHLLMTFTALKRDLNDPKTIEDFAKTVQSPERLKLLTIMTTADIMAVGPERWNGWKASVIHSLYTMADDYLSNGSAPERHAQRVATIVETLQKQKLPDHMITLFEEKAPPAYWHSFPIQDIASHMRFIDVTHNDTLIQTRKISDQSRTEVIIYTDDQKGLFAKLTGALAAGGANVVEANVYTFTNGKALDVFQVQDLKGHSYEAPERLVKQIRKTLSGTLNLQAEIKDKATYTPRRNRHFEVAPRVLIDNDASNSHTIVEVNGKDRPGLLYDLANTLTSLGLQVSSAKITTFGSRIVDSFYIKDSYGLKVLHPILLKKINENLMQILEKNGEQA